MSLKSEDLVTTDRVSWDATFKKALVKKTIQWISVKNNPRSATGFQSLLTVEGRFSFSHKRMYFKAFVL